MASTIGKVAGAARTAWDVMQAMSRQPKHRRFLLLLPVLLAMSLVLAILGYSGVLAPFVYPLF